MALHFQPEHCPCSNDSRASQFLITFFPKSSYIAAGALNKTLQAVFGVINLALDNLASGLAYGRGRLRCWVTSLKGNWKFIRQALSLKRHYNVLDICWICKATCDMRVPWADLSDGAAWKATMYTEDPWDETPLIMFAPGFKLQCVQVDLLHSWYLGMARNIIASVLAILVRTRFFPGRSHKDQLWHATLSCRQGSKGKGLPKHFKFTKNNLTMKPGEHCELRMKAAHTAVILTWLASLMEEQGREQDGSIRTLLFIADRLFRYMISLKNDGPTVLTREQGEQIKEMGECVVKLYLHLHVTTKGLTRYLLFHCRPKAHMFHHSMLSAEQQRRCPASYMTVMDEDWI